MATLQETGLAVKRLQWCHHRESDRRLAPLGVSLVQWDVLRHLHIYPDASLHELARLTFQSDQAMGELARRMIERGLITRKLGAGRIVHHRLTPAGEAVRNNGAGIVESVLKETIGHLAADDRDALHLLLVRALPNAEPSGG